jgi:hypothetical protein
MEVPALSTFLGEAVFDNTTNNPDNPNNPPKGVHEGGQSDQEMMRCAFWLMDYEEGDENIILDSAFYGLPTSIETNADKFEFNIYPNPSSKQIHLTCKLSSNDVHWELTNLFGMVVRSMKSNYVSKGIYSQEIDVSNLASGIYQLSIQSGRETSVKKLTVVH